MQDLLNLARVSWGFSKLRFCDEALFDSLAQAALKRLQNIDLSGQTCSLIAPSNTL